MKSNIEWKQWGKVDPCYGVASWKGKSIHDAMPWKADEIYELGESDWKDFERQWTQYGLTYGRCLEIGCGVGRLTRQLALKFQNVNAVDVSENMIEFAKQRIEEPHVMFNVTNGLKIPLEKQSVDAVFSAHVFQHLDSLKDAFDYFVEIYRVMKPEGTLMIHLPVYSWADKKRIYRIVYRWVKIYQDIKSYFVRKAIEKGTFKPYMKMIGYETEWLFQTFDFIGFRDIEIRIIRTTSNNDIHPFVLATKSSEKQ